MPDSETTRTDLDEAVRRRRMTGDANRADVAASRHAAGRRTARENLAALCDVGSFVEYGGLAIAAQRGRRTVDDLIRRTPADGLIGGTARVNGALVGADRADCAVLSYDYTVLAGTQGVMGHRKKDRLFDVIERRRLPVVLFAEGGGGRPGDTDNAMVAGLDVMAFALWARLSGVVPRIGIASGRCFAGNALLLGCCDLVIATPDASIGMGGPAMIEGGGLGLVDADDVGPFDMQVRNGVIDVAATDEADAVRLARQSIAFFQGSIATWEAPDQMGLRDVVPENRRRAYDVHRALDLIADTGSMLELRAGFARGMVTALAHIEGRPMGIVANNPIHLAGAITSDCADKAARFLQLCEAFSLPVLFLCDTPGIMVGPDAERSALVRHASRLFLAGAALTVPFMTVVLRKGYGLGAQAMAGGSFRAPLMTVAWPTGEFGGMGLEGAVKLAYRKELEAIVDADERQSTYEAMVAESYARGAAINTATYFEIDDVIDPAETRALVAAVILRPDDERSATSREARRPRYVDSW
ncbi:MAG TPA: carboxyl transferase domain-containing protein [Candidatus Saccharimonadales bacterium]|nr:carboxyl transferase domain-containing protein [Candidatus Saccharimonadales bacterium]